MCSHSCSLFSLLNLAVKQRIFTFCFTLKYLPMALAVSDTHLMSGLQDIACLYLFALVLQCFLFIPYIIKAPQYGQDAKQVVWQLLDLVIYAAPPGLPLLLMLVGAVARNVLLKDGLMLLFPEIIKRGAAVDVVCFDKTGTLTDSLVSALRQQQTQG